MSEKPLGKMPEAREKTITQVMLDALTHGGDCSPILAYRAQKAETLLRQIACNTDPIWARKLACDFWGIEAPPTDGADSPTGKGQDMSTGREVLAAAIKRTEEEMALFPEADFPEEHRQARALVAAGKEKLERMNEEREGR